MTITTLSSREFNQDTCRAKKAARDGPAFITDRRVPAHVLRSIEEYRRITGRPRSIIDTLAMPRLSDIESQLPRSRELARSADFS